VTISDAEIETGDFRQSLQARLKMPGDNVNVIGHSHQHIRPEVYRFVTQYGLYQIFMVAEGLYEAETGGQVILTGTYVDHMVDRIRAYDENRSRPPAMRIESTPHSDYNYLKQQFDAAMGGAVSLFPPNTP
jgi:hypothetical protein